jgi:hypothetical protein
MAHNTTLSAGSGGDTITNYDIAAGGAFPTTGKVQAFVLYASAGSSTPPSVFLLGQKTAADSLGVVLASDQGALTVTLPTGASTSANQATIIGHLDGVEGSLATLAGAVSGTEVQVDVLTMPTVTVTGTVAATQSGTWNVGTVTAVTGITNTVTVTGTGGTFPVTDSGGSLTVDGTVAATQSGTWTVQPGNTANTTPWLATIHDGTRAASVRDTGSSDSLNVAIVDASGNQITTFGGGSQYVEDTAHNSGDTGTMLLAVRRDANTTLADTTGDYAPLQVDASGSLKVSIISGAGSGGTSSTDGSTYNAGSSAGTPMMAAMDDVSPSSIAEGTLGIPRLTSLRALHVSLRDSAGSEITTLPVSLASVPSHAVTNSGTFAVQAAQSGTWNVGTVTAVTDASVQGKAAHDAAVSGNPLLVGLEARRARMTAVSADGDAVRAAGDRYGRTQTCGIDLSATPVQATSSGDTTLVAAPGAGSRLKILRVELSNSHASTALTVGVKTASLASGAVFGKRYLPAAGGAAVLTFPGGHLMCGDAEAFTVNLSGAGTIECTTYFETVSS